MLELTSDSRLVDRRPEDFIPDQTAADRTEEGTNLPDKADWIRLTEQLTENRLFLQQAPMLFNQFRTLGKENFPKNKSQLVFRLSKAFKILENGIIRVLLHWYS